MTTLITAVFEFLFGMNESVLRIPAAIMAIVLMFAQYSFMHNKLNKNKTLALLSALIVGTSFHTIQMGRKETWIYLA